MRKTKDIVIEGIKYTLIEILGSKRSVIVLEAKNIFTGAADGIGDIKDGLDAKLDYTKIATGILDRLEPEKGAKLLRDVIAYGIQFPVILREGIVDIDAYDEHFGEYYHHQIELVSEIFKMNFGPSIQELKKKLPLLGLFTLTSSKEKESKQD